MSIVSQNALLNQYVPAFWIKDLVQGQTVIYDNTRKAFINVDPVVVNSPIQNLGQLLNIDDNVDNPLTPNGQSLVYNSLTQLWGAQFVDFTTLLNKPTNLTYSLIGLSDTKKPSTAKGYLRWDDDGLQVVYDLTIPASVITGLSAVATSGTIGALTNVDSAVDTLNNTTDVGKTIQWNGTEWIPISPPLRVVANLTLRDSLTPTLGNQAYVVDSDDGNGNYVNQWSLWIYTITGPSNGWTLIGRYQ